MTYRLINLCCFLESATTSFNELLSNNATMGETTFRRAYSSSSIFGIEHSSRIARVQLIQLSLLEYGKHHGLFRQYSPKKSSLALSDKPYEHNDKRKQESGSTSDADNDTPVVLTCHSTLFAGAPHLSVSDHASLREKDDTSPI